MTSPFQSVAVLGAGAWGTALAQVAAAAGRQVTIWALEPEVVEAVYRSMVAAFIQIESRQHQALQASQAPDAGTMSGCVCA